MDIQQGNVVTSKMMLQLRPGMSKSQVRFIMGTPLIQDSFHSNRWDYFYQMRKEGKIIEQRRVILEFKDEALLRVKGDVIPAGTGDANAAPTTGTEPVSQPEEKKSLMDKLEFWKKEEKAVKPESAPANLVTPAAKEPVVKEPAPAKEVPPVIAVPPAAKPEPVTPAPAPVVESKPEAKPTPAPVAEPVKPEPAKVEEPAPVAKPEPAPEPAPEPVPQKQMEAPAPAPEPVAEPAAKPVEKATEKAVEKPAEKPAEKPVEKPEAKAKPAPAPEKEPAEDEPGYFEYLLQKIGF